MSTELEVRDEFTPSLFGTTNPVEARDRMTEVSQVLVDVVRKQNLLVRIGQSDHLRVEAWTFLGSILGVFPVVEWTRPVLDGETQVGWEARVEARTRSGEVVGAAEAECLRTEKTWKTRDDYALKSMAQTRAVSKAMRGPLGFVVVLAGFNPTPAEEMPRGVVDGEIVDGEVVLPEAPFTEAGEKAVLDFAGEKEIKPLNVLVGKLRTAGHDPTQWIYDNHPRAASVVPKESRGSWAAISTELTKAEAAELRKTLAEALKKVEAAA